MTAFDDIFVSLARRLIRTVFGTNAVLRTSTESYDPATGKNVRAITDIAVRISPPQPVAESRLSGVIQAGDAECYLAADARPNVEDALVWRDSVWHVVRVMPLVSGDQNAAYRVTLRK